MFAATLPVPTLHASLVQGQRLGRGSQAEVFRGHVGGAGDVAIKVFTGAPSSARAQARREARMLATIDHPSVPRLVDAEPGGARPAVVMELVDGASLHTLRHRSLLSSGGLPSWLIAHVAREVASVLMHCATHRPLGHSAPLRLVHGDLKPSNLMLCRDGRVVVIDFGVAVSEDAVVEARRTQGGTVRYLSPQRLMGAPAAAADDLYSLGATMLSLALGGSPVAGHRDPARHADRVDWLLERLSPDHASLRPVLRGLLSHDPLQRPSPSDLRRLLLPVCLPQARLVPAIDRVLALQGSATVEEVSQAWRDLPTVPGSACPSGTRASAPMAATGGPPDSGARTGPAESVHEC